MRHDEYVQHDALGLAALVQAGEVTPAELVEAAIARMDEVNPLLNAVVHRMDQQARDLAADPAALPDGPMRGVPFLVKDMDGHLAGEPCTYASRSLATWVPERDSELFARYRRAGLIHLGKTNCPEFGIYGVTEPDLHGPARNPWDPDHTPGGSSGGSGAAVAAGIVPVAHAGDGGGSIRIPASANGLFGLMPSRGRTPLGPDEGEGWHGLVRRHVVSRTVRDSAALLDATQGTEVGAPYAAPPDGSFLAAVGRDPGRLRIGYSTASVLGKAMDPECVVAVEATAALLEGLGHELVEVELPIDREAVARAYITIVAAGVGAMVEATAEKTGRSPRSSDFEAATWFLRQASDVLSARELEQARDVVAATTRALAALFAEGLDAHLTATLPYPPIRVGENAPAAADLVAMRALRTLPVTLAPPIRMALGQLAGPRLEKAANTQVWNMTGQPAMSVPLHWTASGLPVGVQLAGAFGEEELLFALAGQLEEAAPWLPRLLAGPCVADLPA
ncbi:MAG: amidase [Candidatus Nanopelagicales bacterium]|nr:amidase [Candidatus Nanopelagicales bacterium]